MRRHFHWCKPEGKVMPGSSIQCCGEVRRPSWGQDFKPFRATALRGMPEVTDRAQFRELQRVGGQSEADGPMDPFDGVEHRREVAQAVAVQEKATQDVLRAYRERGLENDDRPLAGRVVHNPKGDAPYSGRVVPDPAGGGGSDFGFRDPTPAP